MVTHEKQTEEQVLAPLQLSRRSQSERFIGAHKFEEKRIIRDLLPTLSTQLDEY